MERFAGTLLRVLFSNSSFNEGQAKNACFFSFRSLPGFNFISKASSFVLLTRCIRFIDLLIQGKTDRIKTFFRADRFSLLGNAPEL